MWCVIYLFVMEGMNPAESKWQWAAMMIRQSVQILFHNGLMCHYCNVFHLSLFLVLVAPSQSQKTIYRKSSTQNGPRSTIILVALSGHGLDHACWDEAPLYEPTPQIKHPRLAEINALVGSTEVVGHTFDSQLLIG